MHWQYCIVAPVYYYFLVGSGLLHVFFKSALTLTKFWKPFAGRFLAVYIFSGIYSFLSCVVEAVFGFWKTVWNSGYLSPIVCMFSFGKQFGTLDITAIFLTLEELGLLLQSWAFNSQSKWLFCTGNVASIYSSTTTTYFQDGSGLLHVFFICIQI